MYSGPLLLWIAYGSVVCALFFALAAVTTLKMPVTNVVIVKLSAEDTNVSKGERSRE
jgi:hypothetical protein